jgi:hypothetical protein
MIASDDRVHECPVREIKEVSCRYCNAPELYWSKEKMEDGVEKNVLMESYGLPHGCDERKKYFDDLSQAKKDEYAKEKARVEAIPDNSDCWLCVGGTVHNGVPNRPGLPNRCALCGGGGKVTTRMKVVLLREARQRIWPSMGRGNKR